MLIQIEQSYCSHHLYAYYNTFTIGRAIAEHKIQLVQQYAGVVFNGSITVFQTEGMGSNPVIRFAGLRASASSK